MAKITLHGTEIEFDKDHELSFYFDPARHFFYLTEKETIALRDFLIAATSNRETCEHPDAECVSDNSEGRTYWCWRCGALQANVDTLEPDLSKWELVGTPIETCEPDCDGDPAYSHSPTCQASKALGGK